MSSVVLDVVNSWGQTELQMAFNQISIDFVKIHNNPGFLYDFNLLEKGKLIFVPRQKVYIVMWQCMSKDQNSNVII